MVNQIKPKGEKMKKLLLLFITTSFVLSQNLIWSVDEKYENGNIKAISYHQKIWQKIELVKKETYYHNGQIESKESYKDGIEDGEWVYYLSNGFIFNKINYTDLTRIWNRASQLKSDGNFNKSIESFKTILETYPSSNAAPKAQYQIANIYTNDIKDMELALEEFEKVLKEKKKELNKNLLQAILEKITKNYDHYIKEEMMADDSTLGEDKVIDTVKKEYFVNNINV